MIRLELVFKYYQLTEGNIVKAVDNVSAEFEKGDYVIIFGRSGSGKTTLLSLMAGLTSPTKGKIFFDGVEISGLRDKEKAALRNRKMGFVFQYPTLIPTLNIMDNVLLPAILSEEASEQSQEKARQLLKNVGLEDKVSVYPAQISSGQMRRVQIARALINNPPVVLADEPTGELDEATEREIMEFLKDIHRRGTSVIMVTHSSELASYATRLFKMDKGTLREVG